MKGYTIQESIDRLEKKVAKGSGGSGGASSAADVSYSNTLSGLAATNVQAAIDEIDGDVDTLAGTVTTLSEDVTTLLNGHVYSNTEQLVGKWTDNSDIYETTVHISALPNAATEGQNYPHGIANIDKIVGVSGFVTFSNGRVSSIPYVIANPDGVGSQINFTVDTTNIIAIVGTDRSSVSADVTLRYRKTAPVTNTRTKKK